MTDAEKIAADPVMEMARKCALESIPDDLPEQTRAEMVAELDAGMWDGGIVVKSALAAIRATTEAAAELIDQCNREGPYDAIGAAALIRANKHIKGSDDGRP